MAQGVGLAAWWDEPDCKQAMVTFSQRGAFIFPKLREHDEAKVRTVMYDVYRESDWPDPQDIGRLVSASSPSPALRALKRETAVMGEAIFIRRDGRPLRMVFARACRRAGLLDVTPPALRHTFASRLTMAGVPLRTIMDLGGWRSLGMVQRSSHLSPAHQHEAVERLAHFPTHFTTPVPAAVAARAVTTVESKPRAVSSVGRAPDF